MAETAQQVQADVYTSGAPPVREGFEQQTQDEQVQLFLRFLRFEHHDLFAIALKSTDPDTGQDIWRHREAKVKCRQNGFQFRKGFKVGDLKKALEEGKPFAAGSWESHKQLRGVIDPKWQSHVYVRTSQFSGLEGGVNAEDVTEVRCWWMESDGPAGSRIEQIETLEALKELGLQFNAVVDSGGKSIHVFIRKPTGVEADWETDRRIMQKLAVLLKGDLQVIQPNRLMRMPGFDRPGGQAQRLLWGTEEVLYQSAEALEEMLDRIFSLQKEEGKTEWEEEIAALGRNQAKEQGWAAAQGTGELAGQWREWEEEGGWTDQERRKAATHPLPIDLTDFVPREVKELVANGSQNGHRNQDGIKITLALAGAEKVLADLGVELKPKVEELLKRYADASENGGDAFDRERLQLQLDGVRDGGAMPSRSVESFLNSLHYNSEGVLGVSKKQTALAPAAAAVAAPAGSVPEVQATPAADLTEFDLNKFHLLIEAQLNQICLITVDDVIYRWVGTHYEVWEREFLRKWIEGIARSIVWMKEVEEGDDVPFHPFLNTAAIRSAVTWVMESSALPASALNPQGMINCRNGVVEISWDGISPSVAFEAHDPYRHLFIDQPGLDYDREADTADAERLLKCIPTEAGRELFLKIAAASLDIEKVRRFADRVPALMLIGGGKNGKDTLREALGAIHGNSSIANISIQDWRSYETGSGAGRFKVANLDRARLSVSSENSGKFKVDNVEALKAAITGDPTFIEKKGMDGRNIKPKAVFMFFLNQEPLLDGGNEAIQSRWAVMKLPHTYSADPKPGQLKADLRFKHDPEFMASTVLPGLLKLLIQALGDAVADGFDLSVCDHVMQGLREETSHLHLALREIGYELGDPTDFAYAKDVYQDLDVWYQLNGWKEKNALGDWRLVQDNDGDEPVKAPRLLPKRLKALYPSIRTGRSTDKHRRAEICGLRKAGGKHRRQIAD